MGYGSIVSFAGYRQARIDEEARRELHAWFDEWLDGLEDSMKDNERPTLGQITGGIFAARQEFSQKVAETLIRKAHHEVMDQDIAPCPKCGKKIPAREDYARTVDTMVGEVLLKRPYFYCVRCGEGFYPLDEALELCGRRKQADVQKAAVRLAAEMPYDTAQDIFAELTGLKLSDHTLHDIVNEVTCEAGVLDVIPNREIIDGKLAKAADGKKRRPVLVLGIDGAHVPTRPESAKGKRRGRRSCRARRARWQGEWREAKGFRFYLVKGDRIEHLLSWHKVQSDEELAQALREIKAAGLIPDDKVRLCVVADGAKWIWKQVEEIFPSAREILDYYHCSEHLGKVASVQFAGKPEHEREWMETVSARLFLGEVDGVIRFLSRMKPKNEDAGKEIQKLANYLKENRERIDYKAAKKGGYPIGSGGIESSNKLISQVRLKRSGAWWYVENANHMLALRCAKYNGTMDKLFEVHKQKAKQKQSVVSIRNS